MVLDDQNRPLFALCRVLVLLYQLHSTQQPGKIRPIVSIVIVNSSTLNFVEVLYFRQDNVLCFMGDDQSVQPRIVTWDPGMSYRPRWRRTRRLFK